MTSTRLPGAARFANKTAFVTGGNRGIGRAIALALAAEGARVVVAARDVDKSASVVAEITQAGGVAMHLACDVAKDAQVRAAATAVQERWGTVHVLVHAAGVEGTRGAAAVTEVSEREWADVVDVNLGGAYRCARELVPGMARAGEGAVVFISSIGGLEALARAAPYVASKTGLIGLTRSMALDYAPHGVRVTCVCPGVVDTDMMRRSIEAHDNPHKLRMQITALHPLGRVGVPDDVAPAVLFLASDEARWMTGVVLPVDGGYMLRRFATAPPDV